MVTLSPMSQTDYERWITATMDEYAGEKVRAGNWPADDAPRRARAEFQQLLPDGRKTPNNHLLAIVDPEGGARVGVIWLAIQDQAAGRAFIYDFRIEEPYRRRGFGLQALRALEALAPSLGVSQIGLHVFGHNHAARALYEKAGYEVTNVSMVRKL
ncbi:MAG TPA: GNAT family N-acetyltransferase [Chloroflexota bacterium]|nr:GNAT family N-acetyltransferase [Chloroflexota bacterium]